MSAEPTNPQRRRLGAIAAAALAARIAPARAASPIRVGTTNSLSDVMIFIADKKSYFRDEALDIAMTAFNSAANMVPPLGAGQLDVGAGSASAGLYNAAARGIRIRIVADKASSQPGYPANKLLVRPDLLANGRFTGPASLKGMKIAMNGQGVSNTSTLNTLLTSVGLSYDDVNTVDMSFPDHLIALQNRSVDASVTTEPTATAAVRAGAGVAVTSDDVIDPGHQIAVLLYSDEFSQRPDTATRFMRAYLRAVRFYNDALQGGKLAGKTAGEVIDIITEYTPLKSRAVLAAITPTGCDPTGQVNATSLQRDLDFYHARGLVPTMPKLDNMIDRQFINSATRAQP